MALYNTKEDIFNIFLGLDYVTLYKPKKKLFQGVQGIIQKGMILITYLPPSLLLRLHLFRCIFPTSKPQQ